MVVCSVLAFFGEGLEVWNEVEVAEELTGPIMEMIVDGCILEEGMLWCQNSVRPTLLAWDGCGEVKVIETGECVRLSLRYGTRGPGLASL